MVCIDIGNLEDVYDSGLGSDDWSEVIDLFVKCSNVGVFYFWKFWEFFGICVLLCE